MLGAKPKASGRHEGAVPQNERRSVATPICVPFRTLRLQRRSMGLFPAKPKSEATRARRVRVGDGVDASFRDEVRHTANFTRGTGSPCVPGEVEKESGGGVKNRSSIFKIIIFVYGRSRASYLANSAEVGGLYVVLEAKC